MFATSAVLASCTFVALSACTFDGADAPPPQPEQDSPAPWPASVFTRPSRHVWVATRDTRECAWPECGGWFVHRVDAPVPEYVLEIELGGTKLTPAQQDELLAAAEAAREPELGTVAFRGALIESSQGSDYSALNVFAAWQGPPLPDGYRHVGAWYSFADDEPELVAREIGIPNEYAVRLIPTPPDDISPTEALMVGWRDENVLRVDYRFLRVR